MLSFLSENLPSIVAGTVAFAIVAVAVIRTIRDWKNKKTSCGCGCSGCPGAEKCGRGR